MTGYRATAVASAMLVWAVLPAGAQPPAPGPAGDPSFYAGAWAVIIGINNYDHQRIPPLRYAVNDARAMQQALLGMGFRSERVILLLEQQATKQAIERMLGDQLRAQMNPDDRLLVFFAGHGKTDRLRTGEEEGYLLPVDADPGQLYSSAIGMQALRQISDRLPAKHILYVVDACYSGYALFNRSISDDLLEEMIKKPAIQILTAGRSQDEAQERRGHGVFTDVLLRALRGDAFPSKGWLALEELGIWVKQRVFAESGRKQIPQYGSLAGEGQFVFVRPGSGIAAAGAPAPAAAQASPVDVRLESTPLGALAYWDTRSVGKTPVTVRGVVPGRHMLVLVLDSHVTILEDIQVPAGPPLTVARTLDPQTGGIEVASTPSGARIELDGVPVGTTPQKFPRVAIGTHRIVLSHDERLPVSREVTVEYEKVARVQAELPPRPARLVITSVPSAAEIWANEQRLGVTVWVGELPPGRHQIRIVKDGYQDRVVELTLAPNEARRVEARLEPRAATPAPAPTPPVAARPGGDAGEREGSVAFRQALTLFRDELFAGAARVLEQEVARDPRNAQAHFYLAESYRRLRRLPEATTHYRRVIDLAPRAPEAERARALLVGLEEEIKATQPSAADTEKRDLLQRPSR